MNQQDYQQFSNLWACAYERSAGSKNVSKEAIAFDFDLLIDFQLELIKKAIQTHCRNNKFAPTVSDIVEILAPKTKQLTADEAWSLCPTSEDETVRWTEITGKAFVTASGLRSAGDEIAARMAFRGAYDRISSQYQAMGLQDKWVISYGNHKAKRIEAIESFVQLGYMTPAAAIAREPSAVFNFSPAVPQLCSEQDAALRISNIAQKISDKTSIESVDNKHPLDGIQTKSRKEKRKIMAAYNQGFEQSRSETLKKISALQLSLESADETSS